VTRNRPAFLTDIPLRELGEWWLRVQCCNRTVDLPGRFLANQKPHARLGDLLERLRCQACGAPVREAVLHDDPSNNAGRYPENGCGWTITIGLPTKPGQ
jgi:hypothetical protein